MADSPSRLKRMAPAAVRTVCNADFVSVVRFMLLHIPFGKSDRLNKFSDEQFIRPRICAEASQILLIAEQNVKFCPRSQLKTLRNGGKNEK